MLALLHEKREALTDLCRRYAVARLEVFGSAATGDFDPSRSDVDFLVEFLPQDGMRPFHQYFDFREELMRLLGREVDLVEACAMKNPYFIKAVNESRKLLYGA